MQWYEFTINEPTGYHNFPKTANKTRTGRILEKPLHYYDKEERELRARISGIVRWMWQGKEPLQGAIETLYFFGVAVPASWSKRKRELALSGKIKPAVRPDLSNKFYWLENRIKGILFGDDALIVDFSVSGRYAEKEHAKIWVRVVD